MSKDKQKPQEKQHAQAPLPVEAAKPAPGWISKRAEELVKAVPAAERELLLGDLLAQLAPLVGETGANETAADALRHIISDLALHKQGLERTYENLQTRERQLTDAHDKIEKLKGAMVARRSPDAGAGSVIEAFASDFQRLGFKIPVGSEAAAAVLGTNRAIIAEWLGLRALLSSQPMRAVAVRDDSTPALAERYALMYVEWDGKRLNLEMLEGPSSPWMDLVRPMNHAVSTRLVPPAFR